MCQPINHKSCVLLVTANHFPKLGVSMVMNSAGCTLDRNENKLNKSWELCDSSDPSGWGHLLSLSSSCKMVNICEFMIKKNNIQDLYQLQISTEVFILKTEITE